MSNLLGTMSIAVGAMGADEGALHATTNNVANANTPGYSRERPVLAENDPVVIGSVTYGSGVSLTKLESVRDPILQLRIEEETQEQGKLNATVTAMQQAQVQFTGSSGDIGSLISAFFSSLNQLSSNPTDQALRQGVLTAAINMANGFNNAASNLTQQRSSLDLKATQDIDQVNVLTSQIATLNTQISQLQGVGQDASALLDQRDVLIGNLSSIIDVSTIQSDDGLTLTTWSGTALVVGGQSFALTTQTNSSGVQNIYSQGNDITSKIGSGELAGLLNVRDQQIPTLLTNLDTLAAGLANGVNAANAQGFSLVQQQVGTLQPGGNIFAVPPPGNQGAAASMAVAISDPELIAASSDATAPGSNGNLSALCGIQSQPAINGQTPQGYYSKIVFDVGNTVSTRTAELNSSQLILNQLQDQRGSISGVSLNEEAANLVQFQRAFDAAAQVVSTINDLLYTVINMGTYNG